MNKAWRILKSEESTQFLDSSFWIPVVSDGLVTRIECQMTQMAVIREDQKGRHFVLVTERRSIWPTKLRENNSLFLWKMKDSDIEFCLVEDVPRSVGRGVGICR